MVLELPVSTSAEVIRLSVDRLPEIARLGAQFQAEGSLPGAFVPEAFVAAWENLIEQDIGVIFALEKNGVVVGGLGAVVFPDPNDGAFVATEMFWFVSKTDRGHGMKLLPVFEEWAKLRDARRVVMVHLENLFPDALRRIYTARGYRPIETHYLKEL